jgi:hypothetical protein
MQAHIKQASRRIKERGAMTELGPDDHSEWYGFRIERKKDMANWQAKPGYVVVEKGCNPMPGAAWFTTVAGARKGIAALMLARRIAPTPNGDRCESDIFWMLMELTRKES